ncbi:MULTISPECIES: hypothetical protein [Rhizobium/Agrobacterium group]|uniref:hypothetical protein n=1 Tax=Rhizobium/Agrobacterium group TaxID=227290 RepID=UPI0012E92BA3|nr:MULTISPECIES: hypothetical protein [Rhizobium/Agrobacterium group]NSY16497.1 hypothetical protein [Neorhizobium sp. AL 9.2.2]
MATRLGALFALAILSSACSSTDRQIKAPCGPLTSFVEASHCGEPQPVNPFTQIMVE